MKTARRNRQAIRGGQANLATSTRAGQVVVERGEAVVGPIAEILPGSSVPGDGGRPWLYFSVPQPTFQALEWAGKNGGIEVTAEHGVDTFADTVWVRIRMIGHCTLIVIPAQSEPFASALEAFAHSGRIRILVARKSVLSAPLAFEVAWTAPTRSQHSLAIQREAGFLQIESGVMGAASYLTTCEAEAPKEWKERLAREAK